MNALKKKVRTDAQSKEMVMKHNKFVSILENRLEVATKKFNLTIAKNTELRKEIDGLLKERAQFNALYTKLVNKINAGKQVINDLIEQATIAFNQRDEELSKIHALRERYEFILAAKFSFTSANINISVNKLTLLYTFYCGINYENKIIILVLQKVLLVLITNFRKLPMVLK